MNLTCYCCKSTYERGKFRCCAPPSNMRPHYWRAQFCAACNKCPHHCLCVDRVMRDSTLKVRNEMEPLRKLAAEFQGKIWKHG